MYKKFKSHIFWYFFISEKCHTFSEHLWVQMWSWDEQSGKPWPKIILDPRFRISHQTTVVCCCVQVTECVCKWETVCSKSFSGFFRKTMHFRVSNPGWGNRTDPIPSNINPSLVQVSQFRLRYSQSVTMVPITGGISETRSESSSQSLPQQQYEGGTLWKRLGVFSEEQLMVPVHTMSCNVIIYTTLVSR